jgi:hypothetical protein
MSFNVMLAIHHIHHSTTLVLQDKIFIQNGFSQLAHEVKPSRVLPLLHTLVEERAGACHAKAWRRRMRRLLLPFNPDFPYSLYKTILLTYTEAA